MLMSSGYLRELSSGFIHNNNLILAFMHFKLFNCIRGCLAIWDRNINNDNRYRVFLLLLRALKQLKSGWRSYKRDLKSLRTDFVLSFDYLLLRFKMFLLAFGENLLGLAKGELMDYFHKLAIFHSPSPWPIYFPVFDGGQVFRYALFFYTRFRSQFTDSTIEWKAFCQTPLTIENKMSWHRGKIFTQQIAHLNIKTVEKVWKKVNLKHTTHVLTCVRVVNTTIGSDSKELL